MQRRGWKTARRVSTALLAIFALLLSTAEPADATHLRGALGNAIYDASAKTVTLTSTLLARKDACPVYDSADQMCTSFSYPTVTQVNRTTGATVATLKTCAGQLTSPTSFTFDTTSQPLFNIATTTYVIDVSCPLFNPNFDYVFSQTAKNRIGGIVNTTNQEIEFETRVRIDGVNSSTTPLYNSGYMTNVPYDTDPTHFFTTNLNALSGTGGSVTYALVTNQNSSLGGYGASRVPCSDLDTSTGIFRISASLCQSGENYATAFSGGSANSPIYYALKTSATDPLAQFTTRDVLLQFATSTDNAPVITRNPSTASISLTAGVTTTITYTATDADPLQLLSFATNTLPSWAVFTSNTHVSPATATLQLTPPIGTNAATSIQVSVIDNAAFPLSATNQLDISVGTGVLPPGSPGRPTVSGNGSLTTLTATYTAPTSGGAVTTYTAIATPALGGSSITGTPCNAPALTCTVTGVSATTLYTVVIKATNSAGVAYSLPSTLTKPAFTVSPTPLTLRAGTAIATNPLSYTSVGTAITNYTATGLPAGLTLNASTGALSGTPTTTTAGATVTITGKDASNNSNTATLTIVVLAALKTAQTITFPAQGRGVMVGTALTVPNTSAVPLAAWSTSKLPITYSLATTVGTTTNSYCRLSTADGITYVQYVRSTTSTNTGSCTVYAFQAGDATYAAYTRTSGGTTYSYVSRSVTFYRESTSGWASTTGTAPAAPSIKSVSPTSVSATAGIQVWYPLTHTFNSSAYAWTTCSISPSLPTGMTFDSLQCQPAGTPTVVSAKTTYTITYTNPAGSSTKTFSLTVAKGTQTITFPTPSNAVVGDSVTMTATASSGLSVSYTSTTPSVCSVSSGVVTATAAGVCTIVASQAGTADFSAATSVTKSFRFAAGATAPVLGLTSASAVITVFDSYTSVYTLDTSLGGTPTSYSFLDENSQPAELPDGLTFNSATGVLYGMPEVAQAQTHYIIMGTNSIGSSTVDLYLTIQRRSQVLSFNPLHSMLLTDPDQPLTALVDSGLQAQFDVDDPAICTIVNGYVHAITAGYCTVTASQPGTVSSYDPSNSISYTFRITVTLLAPDITLSENNATLILGQFFTMPYDVINVGGQIDSFTISPAAPAGVVFDTTYGVFSNGQPTGTQNATVYTITAINAAGSSSATFTLSVIKQSQTVTLTGPSAITVGAADQSFTATASSGLSNFTYVASPSSVCTVVAGKLHAVAYGTCTLTATEAGNGTFASASASITVAIHQAPTLVYTAPAATCSNTTTCTISVVDGRLVNFGSLYTLLATGDPGTYTLSDSTPTDISAAGLYGMSFDQTTGQLSGTVSNGVTSQATFTITLSNGYGSSVSVTLKLTVTATSAPVFTLSPSAFTKTVNTDIGTLYTINNTGSDATSYSLSGTLPAGLTFDTATGLISGTPTAVKTITTYTLTATNSAGSSSKTFTLTVVKATPTLDWVTPASIVYGTALSSTQLNATEVNGVAGSFSYSRTSGTVLDAGSYTITATFTPTDTTNYNTATISVTLVVTKDTTSITLSDLTKTYNGSAQSPTISTGVAGLTYTVTYNGSSTVPTNAGTYTVVVTLTATNYSGTATATFVIGKATPTINWSTPSSIEFGTPLSSTQLNALAANSLGGTYTYDPAAGTYLGVGDQTLSVTFVPTDSQNYRSATATVTLQVTPSSQNVVITNLSATYDGNSHAVNVTTNPIGVTVEVTYNGSTTAPTHAGSYTVVATITQNGYTGSATATLVIAQATPSLAWTTPSTIYYGTALSATQLNARVLNGVAGSFTYDPALGTVLETGFRTLTATFTPTSSDYKSATVTTVIRVVATTVTFTITNLTYTYDGSSHGVTVTTNPAGVSYAVTYDGSATVPTNAGVYAVAVTVVNAPGSSGYSGGDTATLTINRATPTISWSNPSNITYGTTLSTTQLGATSTTPGTFSYDYNIGDLLNVGSYTLNVTLLPDDSTNFNNATASVSLTVVAASATITVTNTSVTYNAAQQAVTITTNPAGLSTSVTYNGSATAPTNAGTYTVVVTITDPNYTGSTTVTMTIGKATATVTINSGTLAQTYNGSARTVTATTTPSGLTVNITYAGSGTAPTNVGSYAIVATISDSNYQGSSSGTLVVSKATATVTITSSTLSQTYNGSARTVTATTSPSGLTVNITYAGSGTAPTNAGSYAIVATINDANYQGSASGTLVVAKAAATVTITSSTLSQTYDGTSRVVTATSSPSGLTIDITYAGSSSAPTNAGSYAIVATINDANYQGSSSGTMVVGKATATVTITSSTLSQTYNGSARTVSATTSPSGLTVTFTYAGSGTAPTNAGSYAIVATINDTNYQGSSSGTLVVGKATATVTITSSTLSQTYNGSARTVTATSSPSGLTIDITYDGNSSAPTNAGSYAIVATINNSNYQGSSTATLVVGKATATFTVTNLNVTYNGSSQAPTVVTNPSGLTTTSTYNGSSSAPTNAGSYTVVITINDSNYQGTTTVTLVIAKATATVTITSSTLSQTYDGTGRVVTATSSPSGLTIDVTYSSSSTAPTNAGTYSIVATINDTNYQGSASGTLVVSKASASLTASNLNVTYNGSSHTPTIVTTPTGLTTTVTYNSSSSAPTNAGSYTVVITIVDNNYSGSSTVTLTIAKASATVNLGSLSHTYNGASHPATATTTPSGLTVTFTYDGSSSAPTAAGSYAVVATIDSTNYTGTASGTLVISQATAGITVSGLNNTYNGSSHTPTITTSPSGLSYTVTYNGSSTAPVHAGTYTVVVTIVDGNYASTTTVTMTIEKAVADVALSDLTYIYDALSHGATATTTPYGLTVDLTYDGSTSEPVNADSYAVVATINDDDYQGTASATLVISSASASISVTDLNHTYDGSRHHVIVTTTPSGLSYTVTYNGSSTNPSAVGSYTVVVTITDPNYSGTHTVTMSIVSANSHASFDNLDQTYDGSPKPVTVITNPVGLNVVCTYDGSATAPTAAGTYLVECTINDPNYSGTISGTLTIAPAAATINATGLTHTYNGSTHTPNVTTNPVGLSYTITYNGSSTAPSQAGTYTVVITVDDPNYQGTLTTTLVINRATATLNISGLSVSYNGQQQSVNITSNPAGLSTSVTYNGSSTLPTNAGTYTVVITVTDPNYTGSTTGTFVINKADPTILWSTPQAITFGTALSGTQLNASITQGITGTFTYTPSSGTVLGNGSHTLSVTFTPDDSNNWNAATTTVTIQVASSLVTFTVSGTSATYNGSQHAVSVTPSTTITGYTVTYNGSTTAPTHAGTYTVLVSSTDPNFGGTLELTMTIAKANTTVQWSNPSSIHYGTALSGTQLNATELNGVLGTFTYDVNIGDVLSIGSHTLNVFFTPTNSVDYNSAEASVTIEVLNNGVTITTSGLNATFNGQAQSPTITTNPAGLSYTITYNGSSTMPTNAGTYTVVITITDPNYSGSVTVTFTIAKADPTIVWNTPASVITDTALSVDQLNATTLGGVNGSFAYNPDFGFKLPVGNQTLSVTFTPSNTTNYNVASTSVIISVVTPATPIDPIENPVTEPQPGGTTPTEASTQTSSSAPTSLDVPGGSPGAQVRVLPQVQNSLASALVLAPTGSTLTVTPLNGWTGHIAVPVITVKDGQEIQVMVDIIVNPEPPENVVPIVTGTKYQVTWDPSPSQVEGYEVSYLGHVVCNTSHTELACSFDVAALPLAAVNPVHVKALGHDGTVSQLAQGLPKVKKNTLRQLSRFRIHFTQNSAVLSVPVQKTLKRLAAYLKARGITRVELRGFTDNSGPEYADHSLSKRRASNVKRYLAHFMSTKYITLKPFGRKFPVGNNKTRAGRAANRRVEIWVK